MTRVSCGHHGDSIASPADLTCESALGESKGAGDGMAGALSLTSSFFGSGPKSWKPDKPPKLNRHKTKCYGIPLHSFAEVNRRGV